VCVVTSRGERAKGAPVLEKIVVGYAADQAGRDAVALAGEIAALTGGHITIAFPYHPALARETSEEVQRRVSAEVRPLLAVATGGATAEQAPVARAPVAQASAAQNTAAPATSERTSTATPTFHWSSSSWPIRALHELAAYEHAQLIVVGAAREGAAAHLKVSLMERMVHGAPCAISVPPAGYAAGAAGGAAACAEQHALKRVGVGFSSSAEGRSAILLARELASASGGGVRVIAGAGLEPALASYAFSSPALGEAEDEIYADTEQTLARVCAQLSAEDGVPIAHETVRGDPAGVLIERSGELDLLVLGSRAYGPLRHALLGSVSAQAMREAHCPVLVVPRGAEGASGHPDEQTAGAAGLA
jgi:nucleotide-binding universal stress UspA family protein